MPTESRGPPTKRLRLESSPLPSRSPSIVEVSPPHAPSKSDVVPVDEELDIEGEHCSICLQRIADRTVVPTCSHEFCFECLLIWTGKYIRESLYLLLRDMQYRLSFSGAVVRLCF